MLSLISNTRDWHVAPEALPYDCPACGSPALVEGTNSVETDWDTHTDVPSETVWLEATRLTCEACHLVLEGSEELEAAGIDPVMENEGIDAGDVYRDFEPDEDWFRIGEGCLAGRADWRCGWRCGRPAPVDSHLGRPMTAAWRWSNAS